jgi:hypothetical protein
MYDSVRRACASGITILLGCDMVRPPEGPGRLNLIGGYSMSFAKLLCLSLFVVSTPWLMAGPITWADWTAADAVSATGMIGGIGISFSGDINPAAQTACGTNFWVPDAPYLSATVDNAPPPCDVIRLTGGIPGTGTQTVTFASPVTDPVFAILSLGQPGVPVLYDFDADFTILSQGAGFFGGGPTSLTRPTATQLEGREGHGAIQFAGTFTSISWTMPLAEFWHGFQVGLPEQQAVIPEPSSLLLGIAGVMSLAAVRASRRVRR